MTSVVQMTVTAAVTAWRQIRREYRHREGHCSRLLFTGYLAPGTRIEIRCPACGRMHVIETAQGMLSQDDMLIRPTDS